MKILITGKNGQVGFELRRALAPLGTVIAFGHAECDLSDADALRKVVRAISPDVIVNPAAYTAVDRAEADASLAHAVNGIAPGVLGEEAAALGALVVHYSTDYVFDGTGQGPYREDDAVNPQNVYGQTKLAGEQALQQSGVAHLIFRTSWVFGAHGSNFARTMLRLAADRDTLNVVADQWGAPTSAALIADVTAQVLGQYSRGGSKNFPCGLYHLAAGGETNWCEYARTVIAAGHAAGRPLKLLPENLLPITTAEFPTPARRPANSRLDTHKLQQAFGLTLPPWQDGLSQVLQQIL